MVANFTHLKLCLAGSGETQLQVGEIGDHILNLVDLKVIFI